MADAVERALAQVSGDTVAESFAALDRLAEEHGFAVLVAVFPRLVHRFASYRFWEEHESVAALSRRHGFHHLDLLDPLAACRAASSTPIGADGYHPSAYGHGCAARAMAEVIVTRRPPA